MSEYTDDSFSGPIQRMSDGARLRLKAVKDGELDSMRASDAYFSVATARKEFAGLVETSFDTYIQAFVTDKVADELLQHDIPSSPLLGTMSGMILALADAQDAAKSSDVTPLSYTFEHAAGIAHDAWLRAEGERNRHEDFKLYTLDMAVVAFTSVLFAYDQDAGAWRLGYQLRQPQVTFRSRPEADDVDENDLVEIELVS